MQNMPHYPKTDNTQESLGKDIHQKVTEQRVADFYRRLDVYSLRSLPIGEFKLYDQAEITQRAESGV